MTTHQDEELPKPMQMAAAAAAMVQAFVTRADGWVNTLTGFGTSRDKTTAGVFDAFVQRISDPELAALYAEDFVARKVVDLLPREMMRQGFSVVREGDEPDPSADPSLGLDHALASLDAPARILEALILGRLFGGALLFIGANDGQLAEEPLKLDGVQRVTFLKVYDRRRVTISSRYADKDLPTYGEPETYEVRPINGSAMQRIHETRCIRFGGAFTGDEERERLDSWDFSVLQVVYGAIRQFHANHKSAELLMSDASQGVWKQAGVIKSIAAGDFSRLQTRLTYADMGRSVARSIIVDPEAGEDFTKVQTAFSGVGDMLDRSANYVAAASEYPVTVLMGQAPAGLSATGDADIRLFYDRVRTEQETRAKPAIMRLVEVLRRGDTKGFEVRFPSLWQESPKERAEREKLEADRDSVRIQSEVITPEEAALSPALAEQYPALDRKLREEMVRLRAEPPAPPTAPAAPPGGAPPAEGATVEDDADLVLEDLPSDTSREKLAAEMTEMSIPACEHGRPNRCPICGVERMRQPVRGEGGEVTWGIAWRPIP